MLYHMTNHVVKRIMMKIGTKVRVKPGSSEDRIAYARSINADPDATIISETRSGLCRVRTKLAEYSVYESWLEPVTNMNEPMRFTEYTERTTIGQNCSSFGMGDCVAMRPEDVDDTGFVLVRVLQATEYLALVHSSWLTHNNKCPIRKMGKLQRGQRVLLADDDLIRTTDIRARHLIGTIQSFDFFGNTIYAYCELASGLVTPIPIYKLHELQDIPYEV